MGVLLAASAVADTDDTLTARVDASPVLHKPFATPAED